MSRVPQIVIVAMALLFAQLQCVVACATQMGTGNSKTEQLPPCHRHHKQSHDQAPGSCAHASIVSAYAPLLFAVSTTAAGFQTVPALNRVRATYLVAFSPPDYKGIASTVLRV